MAESSQRVTLSPKNKNAKKVMKKGFEASTVDPIPSGNILYTNVNRMNYILPAIVRIANTGTISRVNPSNGDFLFNASSIPDMIKFIPFLIKAYSGTDILRYLVHS